MAICDSVTNSTPITNKKSVYFKLTMTTLGNGLCFNSFGGKTVLTCINAKRVHKRFQHSICVGLGRMTRRFL